MTITPRVTIKSLNPDQFVSSLPTAKTATVTVRMVHSLILLACVVACVSAVQLEDVADVKYGQSVQQYRNKKLIFTNFYSLDLDRPSFFMSQAPRPPPP